jgi:hypothetical protein
VLGRGMAMRVVKLESANGLVKISGDSIDLRRDFGLREAFFPGRSNNRAAEAE